MPEIFLPRIASHTIRGFFIAEKKRAAHAGRIWSAVEPPRDLGSPEGYAPLVAAATSPPLSAFSLPTFFSRRKESRKESRFELRI